MARKISGGNQEISDGNRINGRENSVESKFIEAVRDSFLHQHVEKTTRKRGNDDPSLLDLILTDEYMQVSEISHHAPLGKSDHSVMTFDFHCYLDFTTQKEKYSFDKGDYEGMRNELVNSNWGSEYIIDSEASVEDKWSSLKSMLTKLRDTYVPKQRLSGKPLWKEKGNFPMNSNTREAIREKSKAFRAWMAAKSDFEKDAAGRRYTKLRNKAKTLLRKSKRLFIRESRSGQKVTQRPSGLTFEGN